MSGNCGMRGKSIRPILHFRKEEDSLSRKDSSFPIAIIPSEDLSRKDSSFPIAIIPSEDLSRKDSL